MNNIALGIIDAQRGFMPDYDDKHLKALGFGELPVPEGDQIVAPLNRLLGAFAAQKATIFTTQDWHPHITAHFSDNPDFKTNWPVHCVDGTLGAELHPDLEVPESSTRFIKGFEALERGEDDTSYSGHYAVDPTTGLTLPEWLKRRNITEVFLGGIATDYCLGSSAIDFVQKDGLNVTIIRETIRGIAKESTDAQYAAFAANGIPVIGINEAIERIQAA